MNTCHISSHLYILLLSYSTRLVNKESSLRLAVPNEEKSEKMSEYFEQPSITHTPSRLTMKESHSSVFNNRYRSWKRKSEVGFND